MNENLLLANLAAGASVINLAIGIRHDTWWGYICLGTAGALVIAAITFFRDFVEED